MAVLEGLMPPSREDWELLVYIFRWFPLVRLFVKYGPAKHL